MISDRNEWKNIFLTVTFVCPHCLLRETKLGLFLQQNRKLHYDV